MNSIDKILKLIEELDDHSINTELKTVWDKVWGKTSYADFRLYKTMDKIKILQDLGVDFYNKKVLDIGCGDGSLLLLLQKFFNIQGVGIDISEEAIISGEDNGLNELGIELKLGDHRNLSSIQDNSFDIVLSFGVIEHLEEYLLAINEARRVLKTNGILVLIQPHLLSFGNIQKKYLQLIRRWNFGFQRDFSFLYYKKIIMASGFNEIKIYTKRPYVDMKICRFFDTIIMKIYKYWGHYLYIICKKYDNK